MFFFLSCFVLHLASVLVLLRTSNDLFCSCVDGSGDDLRMLKEATVGFLRVLSVYIGCQDVYFAITLLFFKCFSDVFKVGVCSDPSLLDDPEFSNLTPDLMELQLFSSLLL